ncbi:hypothetical protein OROMI_028113 [Orobanche minor]
MAKLLSYNLLFTFIQYIVFGFRAYAVPYDHSFTHECVAKPLRPQYDGGIVMNPEFNEGLKGWTTFGDAKIDHQTTSYDGENNHYIVASKRNQSYHSLGQTFDLESNKLYTFSAWLQVSHGVADIAAIFKTETSYETAGWVTAQKGCWSMLKGGLVLNNSGPVQLYFESQNIEVDIWADSISLQPFSHQEWKSHQEESIEKVRKRKVKFHAMDQHGRAIPNAIVSITQRRSSFPFGCAINQNILQNRAYQNWFLPRFQHTVFENELKWYSTERSQGSEDYSVSDAMVGFAQSHGVSIRGHNVFWEDPRYQPYWLNGLSPDDLRAAATKRVNSVVTRYKGQLFHWDVANENIHFNLFESKLGDDASTTFYQQTNQIDPKTTPFLNDYNTIEDSRDGDSSPPKYLQKIKDLRKRGYNGPLGIGLEGHFDSTNANLPYIRSSLDALASAGLSIWVTELDVTSGRNQASYLDLILSEIHSHKAVEGIMIWAAWSPQGCYRMCLTDNNFNNLATGDVVDKFMKQLAHSDDFPQIITDSNGFYEGSLYHGEYEVKISQPNGDEFFELKHINVVPKEEDTRDIYRFKINI